MNRLYAGKKPTKTMKTFYNAVIAAIEKQENKQKFIDQGIQPIQYIDLYADQYRDPESFDLFAQNALLVEWDIDHTTNPAIANVNFHCCFEQLRFTDSISKNRALGLKFLDYIDIIHEILLQIETEDTGKLQLFSEGFQEMASIVDVYMLNYQCSYVGRKKKEDYKEGDFDKLNLTEKLVKKIIHPQQTPGVDYGLD